MTSFSDGIITGQGNLAFIVRNNTIGQLAYKPGELKLANNTGNGCDFKFDTSSGWVGPTLANSDSNQPIKDLGAYSTATDGDHRWRNLYLSGDLSDGTNSVSIANIATKAELPNAVSGTNDGTNWTSLTIGSDTYGIGGGGGSSSNNETVAGVFLTDLEGPDLPALSETPLYLGCIDYNPIPTELHKAIYYKQNPTNPLNTDYTYSATFITNPFQASTDSVTVSLPDGTTVTPNFKANMIYMQGLNTYVTFYAYFTNPHTNPTYANTVYNDGGKVYLFVRKAQTGAVPTYGYLRFYLRNPITNPTADEIMSTITSNKSGGQQVLGKHGTATAGSSVTIPAGSVVQLDMNNLIRYNQIAPIALLDVASGSMNNGGLKDSRVIINYRDSSNNYYLLEFNTRRDEVAQKWYVWGYNPYSSAITINIDDLNANNFSMYFCYNRW